MCFLLERQRQWTNALAAYWLFPRRNCINKPLALLSINKYFVMGNNAHICNTVLTHPSTKIRRLCLTFTTTTQMRRGVTETTPYEPQLLHMCECGHLRAEPVLRSAHRDRKQSKGKAAEERLRQSGFTCCESHLVFSGRDPITFRATLDITWSSVNICK